MKFTLGDGTIEFTSDEPGNHATMFCADGRLAFRGDLSTFDDAARSYTWVFDLVHAVSNLERFVFATSGRTVVGVVRRGYVQVDVVEAVVERSVEGKPLRLVEIRS